MNIFQNGHLECVRWMVSETEAIAELSCTREYPSLIHYAARYGQVTNLPSFLTSSHHKLGSSTVWEWRCCLSAGEGLAVVASVHAGAGNLSGRGWPEWKHSRPRGSSVWTPHLYSGAWCVKGASSWLEDDLNQCISFKVKLKQTVEFVSFCSAASVFLLLWGSTSCWGKNGCYQSALFPLGQPALTK